MGAANVALAFLYWGHLSDKSFRVLTRMALMSLDKDNPPRYFAGREDLALAIGRVIPEEPVAGDESEEAAAARKERKSVFEIVRRAVKELTDEGVVKSSGGAGFHRRATYSLFLTPDRPNGALGLVSNDSLGQSPNSSLGHSPNDSLPLPQRFVATAPTDRCPLGVEEEEEPSLGIQLGNKSPKAVISLGAQLEQSDDEDLPLTQDQEIARQTAELKKRYGPDLQGDGNGKPKPRVAGEVRRRVRGRQTAADGAGVSPG